MMTEHWLSIAAGVVLVGMMLYGHYRGLLRQCVSLGALVLTIITVKVATPYVTDFVKANPVIRENAAHFIKEESGWQPPEESAPNTIHYRDGAARPFWVVPLRNQKSATGLFFWYTDPEGKGMGFDSPLLHLSGVERLLDQAAESDRNGEDGNG